MKTIERTENLGTLYHPKSALVIYQTKGKEIDAYVEHFDMDKNGNPVNAHPLTELEAKALAKALQIDKAKEKGFLKSEGILPTTILHIDPVKDNGAVLWYTKSHKRQLYFADSLEIPNGLACVPPMVWKANKNRLWVFALASDRRPTGKTALHRPPFFNIHNDGQVCMGTVRINIAKSASVEEFVHAWEDYFFNSYFSHLISKDSPIKGNCVSLWKDLIQTGQPFPKEVLIKTSKTLKNLL